VHSCWWFAHAAAVLSRRCCGDARVCALLRNCASKATRSGTRWFGIVGTRMVGLDGGGRCTPASEPAKIQLARPERHRATALRRRCSKQIRATAGRRSRSPPGLDGGERTIAAPTARSICVRDGKKTFCNTVPSTTDKQYKSTLCEVPIIKRIGFCYLDEVANIVDTASIHMMSIVLLVRC